MEQNRTENKIFDFLKGNSKIFIYSIISLLIIAVVSFFYISNTESKKIKISEDYIKAKIFLNNGDNIKAKEILTKIIIQKDSVYSSLSLFLIIEKKLITDKKFILDHFDLIINQGSLKKEDTNLLKLKKAIYISEIDKEGEIIELLNPIINSESVWRPQALKFLGDFYYSFGQLQKAKQYYSLLNEISQFNNNGIQKKLDFIKNE